MKIIQNLTIKPGENILRIKGLISVNAVFYSQVVGSNLAIVQDIDDTAEIKEYLVVAVGNGKPAPDTGKFIGIAYFAMAPYQVFFIDADEYAKIKKDREAAILKAEAEKKKAAEPAIEEKAKKKKATPAPADPDNGQATETVED